MKLQEFKKQLSNLEELNFQLEDGTVVPPHFHITEVGKLEKHFIDCGGVERKEQKITFQLWVADDIDHRLSPQKLLGIVRKSEKQIQFSNSEIEVEYQMPQSIGKFGLQAAPHGFILTHSQTACLALDACGIGETVKQVAEELVSQDCCKPGSGCC